MRHSLFSLLLALGCSQPSTAPAADPPATTDTPLAESEPPTPEASTPDYDARIASVRAFIEKRSPESELAVIVEKPFVVVGDEPEVTVRRRARRTVRWALTHLREGFFDRDPEKALTIWLFKDERSYRGHTKRLWNEQPDTPYGYYSSANKALVMNIATGGGTLIHELVHPYIEVNFPDSPAWLNEGLGSLFEASSERDGKIVGLLNWRLPGLQEDIEAGELVSFDRLLAMNESEFYGRGSGSHYAQARYLLYYLQQKGLLRRYYRQFVRDVDSDPTGAKTLRAVLGRDDIDQFQREWEAWVLKLRWRR